MRTLIDLPKEQIERLSEICSQEKISRAEAVRRAVEAYVKERGPLSKDDAFGLWGDRVVDGLEYQERIRSEWDR